MFSLHSWNPEQDGVNTIYNSRIDELVNKSESKQAKSNFLPPCSFFVNCSRCGPDLG